MILTNESRSRKTQTCKYTSVLYMCKIVRFGVRLVMQNVTKQPST